MQVDGEISQMSNTPEEYCFRIPGVEKVDNKIPTFILLDSDSQNSNSAFFVTTKEKYGSRHFNTTDRVNSKFDPLDAQNIAYWLNDCTGGFLKNGNAFGNADGKSSKLPQQIIDAIDKNHVWETECGSENDPVLGFNVLGKKSYRVTCGVSLLSYTEFMKYKDKLGYMDRLHENASGVVSDPEKTSAVYYGWWLRTPASIDNGARNLCIGTGVPEWRGKLKATRNAKRANCDLAVRPAFYLNRDFFLKFKMDLSVTGRSVKDAMSAQYTRDELAAVGYTEIELQDIFSTDVQILSQTFTDKNGEVLASLKGQTEIKGTSVIRNVSAQPVKVVMFTACYDGENRMVGAQPGSIEPDFSGVMTEIPGNTTVTVSALLQLPQNVDGIMVKQCIWDSYYTMVPLANVFEFKPVVQ